MLRPLVIAAVAGLAISGLATLVAGRTRGGVIATALLVATMVPYGSLLAPALVVVAIAVGAEGATHHKTPLYNGGVINSLLLTIAAVTLLLTVVHGFSSGAYADAISDVALDASPRGAVTPETDAPDIVMFMLDGFPGDAAARLATAAGSPYDANSLPNALTELGFHVQRNSHSNYLVTPMTLASVFNMRHLDAVAGLADGVGPGEDGRALRRAIATGSALDELHRTGYSLTWIDSGFADAEVHRVDRWVDVGGPTELEIQIMATTALGDAVTAGAPDALSGLHRRRVEQTIGTAVEIAGAPHERPQFVFAHVPAPHAPWVFGPSGESAREVPSRLRVGSSGGSRHRPRRGSPTSVWTGPACCGPDDGCPQDDREPPRSARRHPLLGSRTRDRFSTSSHPSTPTSWSAVATSWQRSRLADPICSKRSPLR